jgi:CopG family transcriptional regulator, nickel-responsive regulator
MTKGTIRFGVSIEGGLLDKFDGLLERQGYTNRSEAIRDLIRRHLVEEEWAEDRETMGNLTLVYDHHVRELGEKMTQTQHDYQEHIISTMHIHLDHHHCMEILVLKGAAGKLKKLSNLLIRMKGVRYGRLVPATAAAGFSEDISAKPDKSRREH